MKKQFGLIFIITLLIALSNCNQNDPQMLKYYKVYNRSISRGKEPGSIHLNDHGGDGIAWIKNKKFTYGTIEFDEKGKDEYQASFVGVAFHGVNDTTFEVVYLRPFNFQAVDVEKRAHSVQYIAMPKFDWPVLREEHPGEYEQPISPAPDPNSWIHVRIVVTVKNISVYVNSSQTPSLSIEPLVHTQGEMLGYWVGGTSEGDWRNFKMTPANQ
ncbi:MAG TPA: hypothetical protein VL442_21025 [Mucilaginibacter sp.]|nr:hypothetical protein [Mucilaginibacter sp.]